LGRALLALVAASTLFVGCGGGSGGEAVSTVACDDSAFRTQDEELYVTKTAISNAVAPEGDPASLLLDLRRARKALTTYLTAHPPCGQALQEVAATEAAALGSLDEAIAALAQGRAAGPPLSAALAGLTEAQSALSVAG
jgi:hypothetical protein